ncbi:C4-dicarboxylate-binding protein DctP [Scopulibacillus darangshiensis]|uniref:C4-dicarboxylate-binding protein DctP n=1 Tax=Scopulibacillus darangshiensis TaxID=442528 RepID=A0A4R2NA06_9BACL|nr:DctP family TRAP transporter solute-binding subunit [Scopulibacillus darangshiensis]TCP17901.1 C4-dicarboxylate-binding protein DctP [Scopulibacillus darangshiensis]
MKCGKTLFFTIVSLLAFTLMLAGCGGPSAANGSSKESGYPKMEIKLSHVAAENTPKGQAALAFKKIVESKSDGKIKVKVYPNGQLYGDEDEIEALQANNVQIIVPSSSKLAGFDPTFQLFDLPFLFKNDDELYRFEDGTAGKELLSKLESSGMKGLGYWPNGFTHITNNERPIKKPEDLKGLKIRTHGGGLLNDVFSKLGASSTKLAFNDVYQGLQLGTVDGQENSLVNIETQKYEEVQKYLTLMNMTRSEYVVATNKKWWDGLNNDTQALLAKAMKKATEKGREVEKSDERKALEKIKSDGKMEIFKLTDAERQAFIDAEKPVMDKWKKKLDEDIIDSILNQRK